MPDKILILGGTKEAAELAKSLHGEGKDVTTSLAGRTKEPSPVAGKIRTGGFGGAEKMAQWLMENQITRMIDATHPFAEQISRNAVQAARLSNIKLEVHQRPLWQKQGGDNWIEVSGLDEAANAIPANSRAFLALGSQHLDAFTNRNDVHFIIRMVDPPSSPLPFQNHKLLIGKPSMDWQEEQALFKSENITHLVCRNSGGDGAYAKIKAARKLILPITMIKRKSMKPPVYEIDTDAFARDPYPDLRKMRQTAPICFVPQLNAILFTKRNDIFTCEKMIDVFSSEQPDGLMTVLMGENMMRKDGDPHLLERKQAFPALSPRTVKNTWKEQFINSTREVLEGLSGQKTFDLVSNFALPVSGHALRHITGLTNITYHQMDWGSQAMIDGVGNYAGDPAIEAQCHEATQMLDDVIDAMVPTLKETPNTSLLSVLLETDQPMKNIRANIKLAISGGQNEPRDAIAGCAWALLKYPQQFALIQSGEATWLQVFEEYARWISPIGMSPRRVAKPFSWEGVEFEPDARVFFMFGSANRDEEVFDQPDEFRITRDTSKAISFGAGPHFCAGAAASRCLIAEVALPLLFETFPNLSLNGETKFTGWASVDQSRFK